MHRTFSTPRRPRSGFALVAMLTLALALVANGAALATAHAQNARTELCAVPPPLDTAGTREETLQGVTIRVPRRFGSMRSEPDFRLYRSGSRIIGLGVGLPATTLVGDDEDMSLWEICRTELDGRLATVQLSRINRRDAPMVPSGGIGTQYAISVTWVAALGGRDVMAWMVTRSQSDFEQARQILRTVRIPRPKEPKTDAAPVTAVVSPTASPACTTAPVLDVDAVVDTALVRMLASGAQMPSGFVELGLTYEGAELAGTEIHQSDLPEASQRQIVTLVSSNLKPRQPTWPTRVLLRATSGETGLSLTAVPESACQPD